MGWFYEFHIHDDEYSNGNCASFGRGGCDEYEWRIDMNYTRGGKEESESVRFTNEQARELYEWLGRELMENYRWMEKLAKDRYMEIERMRKDVDSRQ